MKSKLNVILKNICCALIALTVLFIVGAIDSLIDYLLNILPTWLTTVSTIISLILIGIVTVVSFKNAVAQIKDELNL